LVWMEILSRKTYPKNKQISSTPRMAVDTVILRRGRKTYFRKTEKRLLSDEDGC